MLGRMVSRRLLALLVPAALACASPPLQTGFLDNYGELESGQYLELVSVRDDLIAGRRYAAVKVLSVHAEKIADGPGVSAENCAAWLRDAVVAVEPDLVLSLRDDRTEPIAELRLAITEMSPGSAFGRIFAGELGVGHAWVQVEGFLNDPELDQTIASFTDRRRGSGAHGFRDVAGDSGPTMIREMLEDIAADVKRELQAALAQN